jgi:hypothetical protein
MPLTEQITPMREPFVTDDDIAAFLKIEHRQVLEMTRRGIIPAHPLDPAARRKVWRYKISEVDDAIASGIPKSVRSQQGDALVHDGTQRTMPDGSPRSRRWRR